MSRPTLLLILALPACSSADPGTDALSGGDSTAAGTTFGPLGQTGDDSLTASAPTTGDASATDNVTNASTGDASTGGTTDGDTGGPLLPLDAPCTLGPAAPGRLAVITNDFIDPASVHVLDLATRALTPNIAASPSDPALAWGDGKLVVIGRFGINTLEVLDDETYAPLAKLDVKIDGVLDANPQALTFGPDGRAYLSAFASAVMPIYDLDQADALVGGVDLGGFADRDGSPEPGVSFTCGDTLFVGIQRLVNFVPVDIDQLVAIDLVGGAAIDLDADAAGPQGLPLLGTWAKQVRLDPADPAGHTVLVLTSGIERVDLTGAGASWAVAPERFAGVGVEGLDLQAFAVAADGASAFVLATDGDYPASAVFQVALDSDAEPTKLVSGLTTRERAIERAGERLWIGDADPKNPRLRVLDLGQAPPLEEEPVLTPGAPYLFLPIP
jgi:hypothetical protein